MGGWVKIQTSKGKQLLTLVGLSDSTDQTVQPAPLVGDEGTVGSSPTTHAEEVADKSDAPQELLQYKVLAASTVRIGPETSSTKVGEFKAGTLIDVVQEAVNSDGLKVVHTITAAPGPKGVMGGWVKIQTSKGKQLLAPVHDEAKDKPATSSKRRRGSITMSPLSKGDKGDKEVPIEGQFYRVRQSRAGGVSDEELRLVVLPTMVQFYDANAQKHSAVQYDSIRPGNNSVRTCATGFVVGLNGGTNLVYNASTKDSRSIVMQISKQEKRHRELAEQTPGTPLRGGWRVGDRVDVEGEDGWEMGATVIGPSKAGDPSELRVRFADGVVDDWPFEDFRSAINVTGSGIATADANTGTAATDSEPPSVMAGFHDLTAKATTRQYDASLESEIKAWMSSVGVGVDDDGDFMAALRSGIVLCNLANALQPGVVTKINKMSQPFMQMENISAFLIAAEKLGVQASDRFQTVDLFEKKQPEQVLLCLQVLMRLTGQAPSAATVLPSPQAPSSPPVAQARGTIAARPLAVSSRAATKPTAAGSGVAKPAIPRGKGATRKPPQGLKGQGRGIGPPSNSTLGKSRSGGKGRGAGPPPMSKVA
jgi:hypothetical protein